MHIFFVEGNNGTGKSTLLSCIQKHYPQHQVIYEPVDMWTELVDSSGTNILDYFYRDMKRYAYTFQNLAFISRIEKLNEIDYSRDFVFIERSVWSDCNVFAQNCYEEGTLTEIEYKLYKRWFEWATNNIKINGTYSHVYLRCSPEISADRMKNRGRKEESAVSLDYLRQIHNKHEKWLMTDPNTSIVDATVNYIEDEEYLKDIIESLTAVKKK